MASNAAQNIMSSRCKRQDAENAESTETTEMTENDQTKD